MANKRHRGLPPSKKKIPSRREKPHQMHFHGDGKKEYKEKKKKCLSGHSGSGHLRLGGSENKGKKFVPIDTPATKTNNTSGGSVVVGAKQGIWYTPVKNSF